MVKTIEPYNPDLASIKKHSQNPEPFLIDDSEYEYILKAQGLYKGTRLSDKGFLRAMEAGLIKIWDQEEDNFDLKRQCQGARLDLRLGHHFWHYSEHRISRLTMGKHQPAMEELDLLAYNYKVSGDSFVFHPSGLVLALVEEGISLSNAVIGSFDGRSLAGRLGISNHQTAGEIGPGFAGKIIMELSNANKLDIAVKILDVIGSIGFHLLDQPSTRPYGQKPGNLAYMQVSPFKYWKKEWDESKRRALEHAGTFVRNGYELTGDPLDSR